MSEETAEWVPSFHLYMDSRDHTESPGLESKPLTLQGFPQPCSGFLCDQLTGLLDTCSCEPIVAVF